MLADDLGRSKNLSTHLGNHVTFRMPAFILPVPVHLDELLQDGRFAAYTLYSKARRVVEVTICHHQLSCLLEM
jgi:hypothetical protein